MPEDVPALLAISYEAMETYREWAPDFDPPDLGDITDDFVPRATDPASSWFVVEEDGAPVAHALLIPATASRVPSDDPHLGHVVQVFARQSHWGPGAAKAAFAAIVEDAPRLGYTHLRLFTPAQQHRARRFYVREGWTEAGVEEDTPLGFPMVEYRLACPTQS